MCVCARACVCVCVCVCTHMRCEVEDHKKSFEQLVSECCALLKRCHQGGFINSHRSRVSVSVSVCERARERARERERKQESECVYVYVCDLRSHILSRSLSRSLTLYLWQRDRLLENRRSS